MAEKEKSKNPPTYAEKLREIREYNRLADYAQEQQNKRTATNAFKAARQRAINSGISENSLPPITKGMDLVDANKRLSFAMGGRGNASINQRPLNNAVSGQQGVANPPPVGNQYDARMAGSFAASPAQYVDPRNKSAAGNAIRARNQYREEVIARGTPPTNGETDGLPGSPASRSSQTLLDNLDRAEMASQIAEAQRTGKPVKTAYGTIGNDVEADKKLAEANKSLAWQKEVMKIFPGIGVKDSEENKEFVKQYNKLKGTTEEDGKPFDPMKLAERVVSQVKETKFANEALINRGFNPKGSYIGDEPLIPKPRTNLGGATIEKAAAPFGANTGTATISPAIKTKTGTASIGGDTNLKDQTTFTPKGGTIPINNSATPEVTNSAGKMPFGTVTPPLDTATVAPFRPSAMEDPLTNKSFQTDIMPFASGLADTTNNMVTPSTAAPGTESATQFLNKLGKKREYDTYDTGLDPLY